jgi:hypothetical protein
METTLVTIYTESSLELVDTEDESTAVFRNVEKPNIPEEINLQLH